jgi:hypothetical protein
VVSGIGAFDEGPASGLTVLSLAQICFRIEAEQVVVHRRLVSNIWEAIAVLDYSDNLHCVFATVAEYLGPYEGLRDVEIVLPLSQVRTKWIECSQIPPIEDLWTLCADEFAVDRSDTQIDIVSTGTGGFMASVTSTGELKRLQALLGKCGFKALKFIGLLDRDHAPRDSVFFSTVSGCLPRLNLSSTAVFRCIHARQIEYFDVRGLVPDASKLPEPSVITSDAESIELRPDYLPGARSETELCDFTGSDGGANTFSRFADTRETTLLNSSPQLVQDPSVEVTDDLNNSMEFGSRLGNSVIIYSPFGGSGKTLFGQLVRRSLEHNNVSFRHVVADQCGPNGKSTTGALFSSVVDLGVGETPKLNRVSQDENASLKYWDRLGEVLVAGDAIVEFGTNVASGPIAWARKRKAGKIVERLSDQSQCLVLILPRAFLSSTDVRALTDPFMDQASWRVKRIVLCVNDYQSVTSQSEEFGLELGLEERVQVVHLRMPHCTSSLLPQMQSKGIPLPSCSVAEFIASSEFSDLDTWEVTGAAYDLFDWMDAFIPFVFKAVVLS